MDINIILKQYFGHAAFRPGQEELIRAILQRRDAMGIMPTGGGKSLCYQVPALMMGGITLVISPLISLMKDQVAALKSAGVDAAYINSSLTPSQVQTVISRARAGAYRLIYLAPERLETYNLLALAKELEISMVAVDEAHCISQWGQDFRPSYLGIADFIRGLPCRPVVAAFTATATAQVQEDICRLLELRDPIKAVTGFDRSNLFFDILRPRDKDAALLNLIRERKEESGIVYCATRNGVEAVCNMLNRRGIRATRYHAGLTEEERHTNQDDFQYDRKTCMVATNAFGMGIDKSNVSYVIHYNMPKNLEAYYQEAGRAGRDGEKADCILLFAPKDITLARYFIDNGGNESLSEEARELIKKQEYRRLGVMIDYCRTEKCLRGKILDYFGQKHPEGCTGCGNCRNSFEVADVTRQAQMMLSCILRVRERMGYYVGRNYIIMVLRGSRDKRLLENRLDTLSTYGLLKDYSQEQVIGLADILELEGYMESRPPYGTLELTEKARRVLFEQEKVTMAQRIQSAEELREALPAKEAALFNRLRELRTQLAAAERVPAYIIFSNTTLSFMAVRRPVTIEELLEIPGVGEAKAKKYGEVFLRTIRYADR